MAKKKGRSGGGAKRGRGGGGGSRSRQQTNNNNNAQQQQQNGNGGGHKVHQNQFLQQQRRLQMQRNSRCRLFYLQQHLILKVFNFLDQEGRESAFKVMGWSMDSHQRRKEEMQRQRQVMEKMKERNDWKKDIFKNVLDAEDARNKNNEKLDSDLCNDVEKNMVVSSNDFAYPDETQDECETREKLHDILPPLFASVDADTLLARLNTRRLYQRLCHYKREDARKLAEHIAKYSNKDDTFDDVNENGGDGGETTIVEMFEGDLRNETTANRIYPKNLTIAQMAEKEWDDLMVRCLCYLLGIIQFCLLFFYSPKE